MEIFIKNLGKKYGPIDLTMINIGAYNFKPMFDKSIYHTTPEEALKVAQDLKSEKGYGNTLGNFCFISRTHYGTTCTIQS